jgi:hypothetical protein
LSLRRKVSPFKNKEKTTIVVMEAAEWWIFGTLLLLLVAWMYYHEYYDILHGSAYRAGTPHASDSIPVLFEKLDYCLTAETRVVRWRRAFFVAIVVCALFWWIFIRRFPRAYEWTASLLIVWSLIYFSTSFEQYHISRFPREYARAILAHIRVRR